MIVGGVGDHVMTDKQSIWFVLCSSDEMCWVGAAFSEVFLSVSYQYIFISYAYHLLDLYMY